MAESYFAGTTGYGYDDLGRDKLDEIYADIFGTEDALVRVGFVNGTHAISCALFGALKPGQTLVSAVGAPYDTLLGVIGVTDKGPGSLKDYGIQYRQVDLVDDEPDREGLAQAVRDPKVGAVLIQRSRGYATRASLSVAEIGKLCKVIREANPEAAILVDNCYGEFVETIEPTQAGADLESRWRPCPHRRLHRRAAGPGGGRLHAPDHPRHWAGVRRQPGQHFGEPERLKKFCRGIQKGAPVDSYVVPEPWDMPGYDCPVIMAAGAFIQGASIELSADAPMREPYTIYLQGGLTYESGKAGILLAVEELLKD